MGSQVTNWYTSDLHIGHEKVARLRGFETVEEHDAHVAKMWDERVGINDVVFVLGDIGLTQFESRVFPWFQERPARALHLVAGNHDPVHPSRSGALKEQRKWLKVFDTINPYLIRKIEGHRVALSHFPYRSYGDGNDHGEPLNGRFAEWRVDEELGLPLLHGHTHETFVYTADNMLHVGWDAWGAPVHESEVRLWLAGKATRG